MKIKLGSYWVFHEPIDETAHRAIFAQVDVKKYALIVLETGNRWDNPVYIDRPYGTDPYMDGVHVTEDEWKRMTDNRNFVAE